ncbi:erythromycin esterase family protein [Gracilibacillus sp. S3-1-1]|uniref:Erythromycin esterase family protein n=1 Tax=Gracilibacillus pellucidus TaxID=3095368 RepID=A0ACC6M673_9BACI|nr:erythromycin esterase family protein [Gracilibacillus sp. S3-1-1]MDX8046483.1 erythromycin esterase family protein [Gracilibacillus sp. S3-1-1]
MFKKIYLFAIFNFIIVALVGCGQGEPIESADQYVEQVDQLFVPDDVKIIGLGEATHGNAEFQHLKQDVFEALIHNENVQVFVLEADFGSGQTVNQFILQGKGTAHKVVKALNYDIYNTEQMVAFVQWMHDYNESASDDQKIYFYGNDMQRYDQSKKGLLNYYEMVEEELAAEYEALLEGASNDRMRELTDDELSNLNEIIEEIMADLQRNREEYIRLTQEEEYELASQYAKVMHQRTTLFLNEDRYTHLRDQYLAENLEWIADYEQARGHDKVLMSGHNGHIEKTSATATDSKSMGSYLNEQYGSQYYAIGTDIINSEFQSKKGNTDEREIFTVTNHNELVDAFSEVEQNIFFVDFEQASQSGALQTILSNEQKMTNIGDQFSSWYKLLKMFYTIKMTPIKAYDGIIIVKEATPTEEIS